MGVRLDDRSDGLFVVEASDDLPASAAGVESGDQIIYLDDTEIEERRDVIQFMAAMETPRRVRIGIKRDGAELEVPVVPVQRGRGRPTHAADRVPGGISERNAGFPNVFCHDTPLLPEHCGGPLIDSDGRCIGLNIARVSRTHSVAIPAHTLFEFLIMCKATDH